MNIGDVVHLLLRQGRRERNEQSVDIFRDGRRRGDLNDLVLLAQLFHDRPRRRRLHRLKV